MVDEEEAKRQRKAAKKAAKAAAAAAEEEEVDEEEAKRQRKAAKKAAKAAAAAAEEEKVDVEDAKRQRKAAKKAAAAAAAAAEEEVDEEEAKRQRKAAKKAAKAAAAAAAEEEEEAVVVPKKRAAELEEAEEAPKAKKAKTEEAGEVPAAGKEFKVFIKGLAYSVDEATLRTDFSECGEISKLQFPVENGQPKGFAFISFATKEGFDAALKFDNTEYNGRYIHVSESTGKGNAGGKNDKGKGKGEGKAGDWNCPKCGDLVFARNNACRQCGAERPGGPVAAPHDHENTVFIRGLPWAATEEALLKDFGECGEIESLRMPMNSEGRPAGIAFMKFKTPEGVEAALKFDETDYGGRYLNVLRSGEGMGKGKGKGKDKGKDGKDGKDGKGKDGKGKGKKGKSKAPSDSFAKSTGCIVASTTAPKTFDDSDDE